MHGGDIEGGDAFRHRQFQLVITGRALFHAVVGNCEITPGFAVESEIGDPAEGDAIDGEARGNDDLAQKGRLRQGLGSRRKGCKTQGCNGDDTKHEAPSCGG